MLLRAIGNAPVQVSNYFAICSEINQNCGEPVGRHGHQLSYVNGGGDQAQTPQPSPGPTHETTLTMVLLLHGNSEIRWVCEVKAFV